MPHELPRNPATYSKEVLAAFEHYVPSYIERIAPDRPGQLQCIDPFGGTGKIIQIQDTFPTTTFTATEIEEEWAAHQPAISCVADAMNLINTFGSQSFDWAITSPPYANRMADNFTASTPQGRHTYRHYLGRELSPNNIGRLQWTDARMRYQSAMTLVWIQLRSILKDEAIFVLNIKDHIRNKKQQRVSRWHDNVLQSIGFVQLNRIKVSTPGQRHGENRDARVDYDNIYIYRLDKDLPWRIVD